MFHSVLAPFKRALLAAAVLLSHLLVVCVMLLVFKGVEIMFQHLWESDDPMIYDQLPLRYLFNTIDVVMILTFMWYAWKSAAKAFRE